MTFLRILVRRAAVCAGVSLYGVFMLSGLAGADQAGTIMPGVQVGPVMLGMSDDDAANAAGKFKRTTGCVIDLIAQGHHVVAAGSRFGGCLSLAVPEGAAPAVAERGSGSVSIIGIGGSASALVRAFGRPLAVPLRDGAVALICPDGLVARVVPVHDDGIVTYFAIVPPGTTTVPSIGYFLNALAEAR